MIYIIEHYYIFTTNFKYQLKSIKDKEHSENRAKLFKNMKHFHLIEAYTTKPGLKRL